MGENSERQWILVFLPRVVTWSRTHWHNSTYPQQLEHALVKPYDALRHRGSHWNSSWRTAMRCAWFWEWDHCGTWKLEHQRAFIATASWHWALHGKLWDPFGSLVWKPVSANTTKCSVRLNTSPTSPWGVRSLTRASVTDFAFHLLSNRFQMAPSCSVIPPPRPATEPKKEKSHVSCARKHWSI